MLNKKFIRKRYEKYVDIPTVDKYLLRNEIKEFEAKNIQFTFS